MASSHPGAGFDGPAAKQPMRCIRPPNDQLPLVSYRFTEQQDVDIDLVP